MSMRSKLSKEIEKIKLNIWDIERIYAREYIQHELRTPLTSMSLCLEELEHHNELSSEKISILINSVRQAINLIEYKNNHTSAEAFDVKEEIIKCLAMTKNIRCKLLNNSPSRILLKGESHKFRQVITNIVNNAQEASPIRGKKITIDIYSRVHYLELKMSNKFSRIYPIDKRLYPKAGLGLEICRKILRESFFGSLRISRNKKDIFLVTIKIPILQDYNV